MPNGRRGKTASVALPGKLTRRRRVARNGAVAARPRRRGMRAAPRPHDGGPSLPLSGTRRAVGFRDEEGEARARHRRRFAGWRRVAVGRALRRDEPAYLVGKRDGSHAAAFVADLSARLRGRVQISSDGLSAYVDSIERAWDVLSTPHADLRAWRRRILRARSRSSPASRRRRPEADLEGGQTVH